MERCIGLDIGAETIKAVELVRDGDSLRWTRRGLVEHHKEVGPALLGLLRDWGFAPGAVDGAAVTGRLARGVELPRVPTKQAQAAGHRFLRGDGPATIVSIGSHGFSVLELRDGGVEILRENSRCSQGTGNFLRQLTERFELGIDEASELCADVADPAPLSGRCPVILKTDMTHLANKGESRARILAGLFDAVCENVQVLLKPALSPPRVALVGGVSRSRRVRAHFSRFLAKHGMELLATDGDDALFVEALGAAMVASAQLGRVPALDELLRPPAPTELDRVPALAASLDRVTRMTAPPLPVDIDPVPVVLGFDIGSTGSKAVALDRTSGRTLWEGYMRTSGDPVGAAQSLMRKFVDGPAGRCPVVAVGATGSGREIAGSLLSSCYGGDAVFVLNEIAAHAEGALHWDVRVDTIFEIGGQDAKYIRLADGRVVDAAMNEACSAGTGSFIEEQGKKFAGITDVVQLGAEALAADEGVSLGQHCSVFMAEIIDEAVAAGVNERRIVSGIYDSIIQNYLNRVKGSRSVGSVIFCQGMPFAADALAAAVARQTGSRVIVPPNPGTVGAMGIALLARKAIGEAARDAIDPARFLAARVERKDTFICDSNVGCGGAGNKCRIDRLSTVIGEVSEASRGASPAPQRAERAGVDVPTAMPGSKGAQRKRFTWGGGCSLWDKGTRRQKLPDLSPDPFREREELAAALRERLSVRRGRPVIALTDEFALKGLFPFFATFLHELGFDLAVTTGADQSILKRGIERANVPFCAPMQQYHGLATTMADGDADFLFLPMLRELPPVGDEPNSVTCPVVQGSADVLAKDLEGTTRAKIVAPVIDVGRGLASPETLASCARLALELGAIDGRHLVAHRAALAAQAEFDGKCLEFGQRALAFCAERELIPVVVLGRSYTIYNQVLNSNVPAILREQGAVAIPIDCYPVESGVPVFDDLFWGWSQRILRAAHQARRDKGVYALYCSNYSCGPDSFNLHFYAWIMEGKPFAVVETDGHSGDAGTRTRVEAFLHCVREDLAQGVARRPRSLAATASRRAALPDIRERGERILLPRMGPGAETLAAAFRGVGIAAESLPMPTRETLRLGRRHTSGKECVPMTITLGSLLERIEPARDTTERFALFMPTAEGPCRFGVYNLLHKITLERLGWQDRVRVWSPSSSGYFDGIPAGFSALVFSGFMGADLLLDMLYDVRPVERTPGAAQSLYRGFKGELDRLIEAAGSGDLSTAGALWEVGTGRLFGVAELLGRAGRAFAAQKRERALPTVLLVGEIYARCDDFANDFVVDKLERRGLRVRFAPFTEWLEYTDLANYREGKRGKLGERISSLVQSRIQERTSAIVARELGWGHRTTAAESLDAASGYLREALVGEAVLTLGGPVHEWREGKIDAVISVGPHECMPTKIAESQLFHVAQREGLLSLTLALNGDPIDPEVLDNFAFETHARFARREGADAAKLFAGLGDQRPAGNVIPRHRLVRRASPAGACDLDA